MAKKVKISNGVSTPIVVKGWPLSKEGKMEGTPIYAILNKGDSMPTPSFDYHISLMFPWPENEIKRAKKNNA